MRGAAIVLLVFIASCVTCQGIKLFTKFVVPKTSYDLYNFIIAQKGTREAQSRTYCARCSCHPNRGRSHQGFYGNGTRSVPIKGVPHFLKQS